MRRNWLISRKLRVDILTIFAILMITITAIIISYSYIKSSAVILNLGARIVKKSTQDVIGKFNDYIRPASFIEAAHVLLNDDLIDTSDEEKLLSIMQILLQAHPQLAGAYIADYHNTMFSESPVHDTPMKFATQFVPKEEVYAGTKFISEVLRERNGKMYLSIYFKDGDGIVLSKKENIPTDYQPTKQNWFQGALKNGESSWIQMNFPNDIPGAQMTVALNIKKNGRNLGVIGVDVSVEVIRSYLEKSKVSKNSLAFIVNNSGKVITTLPYDVPRSDILPTVTDLHDKRLSEAYRLFKLNKQAYFIFKVNEVEYMAIFIPYALIGNDIWEIGTIVPTDDFIGESKIQHHQILFFSIIMLLLGLLFILLFSHRISKPIMRLADDTKSIKNLDFSKSTVIESHIYEIQVLTAEPALKPNRV